MTCLRPMIRHLMNRNAVLLAVYILADRQGLLCHATNASLAEVCGRSVVTVRECLRDLEADGDLAVFDRRDGLSHRLFVLRDHRDAETFISYVKRTYRRASKDGQRA